MQKCKLLVHYYVKPPTSEGSRKVANFTERKNLHTPEYGVRESVCLSVFGHIFGFAHN